MNDERKQVDKVLQEFHGQLMTEDEGFIAPDFIAMARTLIEARVERDRMERGIEAALNENEATRVLLFRNEELKRDADTLRTQLAAAREALRDIAENYDHEEQTRHHNPKYGGHCRVCVATAALSEAP